MSETKPTFDLDTLPVGRLGIVPLRGCQDFCQKVDNYIVKWRQERKDDCESPIAKDYLQDSYIIEAKVPRFGSGEA